MGDLHELFLSGKIDARIMGHLSHRIHKCGVEQAGQYAVPPMTKHGNVQQTGKYQKKMDSAYGFSVMDQELYPVDTALCSHITGEREVETVWMQPLHESLAGELESNPELVDKWEACAQHRWIDAYEQHPEVQRCRPEDRKYLMPCAIYMDASRFRVRDSLLVMTVHLLFSGVRHLIFALPKTSFCDCGCGGWCTLYPLYVAVAWSMLCALRGKKPSKRHDSSELDEFRQEVAGCKCKYRFIVIDFNADWAEIALRWGFPTATATLGCFLCRSLQHQLRDATHNVCTKDPAEYWEDCARCEIWVCIDTMQLRLAIRFALIDDSTRKGRVLREDIPLALCKVGLRKGDRLEPCAPLMDVFAFEKKVLPFIVLFWRIPPIQNLTVHHRHPVISRELGTSLLTFGIDALHTLHLGVFPAWSIKCLVILFAVDVFFTRSTRLGDHMRANALALMALLKEWYPLYEATLTPEAHRSMTRITYISVGMIGGISGTDDLDLKAQENRHFLPFCLFLIRKYRHRIEATCDFEALETAGQALEDWMAVCAREPRKMSEEGVLELERLSALHFHMASRAGVKIVPKHHLVASILF